MFAWNSSKLEEEIAEKDHQIQALQLSIKELNIESKEHDKLQAKTLRAVNKKLEHTESELEKAHRELESLKMKLQEMVSEDETYADTYNKRYFYDVVEPIISLSKREKESLSLVCIGVDKLKDIVKNNGEETASRITQVVVQTISKQIRESDVFVKFDDKKFVILLPNTSLEHAQVMAEKLRKEVEAIKTVYEASLSISIGIAEHQTAKENINATLERADAALLKAKEQGGNQICA